MDCIFEYILQMKQKVNPKKNIQYPENREELCVFCIALFLKLIIFYYFADFFAYSGETSNIFHFPSIL